MISETRLTLAMISFTESALCLQAELVGWGDEGTPTFIAM
jgi:hypothetical protein